MVSTAVVPLIRGRLPVQRFTVPYRVYGEEEHTLIFINGIHQSMAMWHSFVRRFGQSYRIELFDFPNQGTRRIVAGSSTVTLNEQLRSSSRPTICSASWGGVVALAYAVRHPHGLRSLILASIGMRANQKMIELITKGLSRPNKDGLEVAEALIESVGHVLPDAMKNRIIGQFQRMSSEALQAFCQHRLSVITVRDLREVVDLGKVRCETILLHGENDAIIDLEDVRLLAAEIPRAQIQTIKDVGHFLHLEKEELLDVYDDILASLRSNGEG